MGRVKLVVFDWAGTAVDFGCRAPAQAFIDAFAAAGVAVTAAEARGPMGLAKKDHLRAMLRGPALAARWGAARGRPWSEADVDALYREVTPRQVEAAERLGEPVPGLVECVAELRRRGVKVGGTTGYFREAAEAARRAAARHGYEPDCTVCSDDVPAGRPAPWMLFRVMEALGVYPPAAVVKVGDTAVDVGEALNAGAWAVGVIDGGNAVGLSADEWAALGPADREPLRAAARRMFAAAWAHAVVNSVADVPAVVEEIEGRGAAGGPGE